MLDDSADDLFAGFWPFMKRALFLFLPAWIFLLAWSAGAPPLLSSVLAGTSVGAVIFFEKMKMKQATSSTGDAESLIK